MAKQAEQSMNEADPSCECLPGYLTVKEAARIIGVSESSVYGYVHAGKLSGARIGYTIVVSAEHVRTFERKAPGRSRIIAPPWHRPPLQNLLYLTTITVCIRPGQNELLERKLQEMRAVNKHLLPGTAARYIARDPHDPDKLLIALIWRSASMPSEKKRAAALAAFSTDLAEVLAWETATSTESLVLLHA